MKTILSISELYQLLFNTYIAMLVGAVPILTALIVYLGKKYQSNNLVHYFLKKNRGWLGLFVLLGIITIILLVVNSCCSCLYCSLVILLLFSLALFVFIIYRIIICYMPYTLANTMINDLKQFSHLQIKKNVGKRKDIPNSLNALCDVTISFIKQDDIRDGYNFIHKQFIMKTLHNLRNGSALSITETASVFHFLIKINHAFTAKTLDKQNTYSDSNIINCVIPDFGHYCKLDSSWCELIWYLILDYMNYRREDLIWMYWDKLAQYVTTGNSTTNQDVNYYDKVKKMNLLFNVRLFDRRGFDKLLLEGVRKFPQLFQYPINPLNEEEFVQYVLPDDRSLSAYKFYPYEEGDVAEKTIRTAAHSYYQWYKENFSE